MPNIQLTRDDFQSILTFVVDLARTAGALILEGSAAIQSPSSHSDIGEKKNSVDLVTEYDVRVEELVKKSLKDKYPDFQLYASHHPAVAFLFTPLIYAVSGRNPTPLEPESL